MCSYLLWMHNCIFCMQRYLFCFSRLLSCQYANNSKFSPKNSSLTSSHWRRCDHDPPSLMHLPKIQVTMKALAGGTGPVIVWPCLGVKAPNGTSTSPLYTHIQRLTPDSSYVPTLVWELLNYSIDTRSSNWRFLNRDGSELQRLDPDQTRTSLQLTDDQIQGARPLKRWTHLNFTKVLVGKGHVHHCPPPCVVTLYKCTVLPFWLGSVLHPLGPDVKSYTWHRAMVNWTSRLRFSKGPNELDVQQPVTFHCWLSL